MSSRTPRYPSEPYVNFFQPSSKLRSKRRQGARVLKWHDVPATPFSRLLASDRISTETKKRLQEVFDVLDPVQLLADIRKAQQLLATLEVGRSESAPELFAFWMACAQPTA